MKEITYEDLYFIILVNKLAIHENIEKEEMETIQKKVEKDYFIIRDFTSSNSLEELLTDHSDLITMENNRIEFTKSIYIKTLEMYKNSYPNDFMSINNHLEEEYKKNRQTKIEIINNKYLRGLDKKTKEEIEAICTSKNKVFVKSL